jgi:N utilization substance protein B
MSKTRIETRARARAVQALYAWDLRNGAALEPVAAQLFDDMAVDPDERRLASRLVRAVEANREAIDEALRQITTNWRLERLGAVERSVLRLCGAELTVGVTPPRVAIQEAVRLAERFGSAQSARFVNGVLDALARRLGRL